MVINSLIAFLIYVWAMGASKASLGWAGTVALAHMLPFLGPSRGVVSDALGNAFPDGVPFLFSLATTLQSTISASLLFLIILALRNRFRIK
jgi:hypothetical protein